MNTSNQLIEAAKAELEVVNERLRIADQIRSMLMRADMPGGAEGSALELLATELNGLERGLRANPPTAQPDEQAPVPPSEGDTISLDDDWRIPPAESWRMCERRGDVALNGKCPAHGTDECLREYRAVPSEGEVAATLTSDHFVATIDEIHAENVGGDHREGFCKACADANLVGQRFAPAANTPPDGHVAVYLPVEVAEEITDPIVAANLEMEVQNATALFKACREALSNGEGA